MTNKILLFLAAIFVLNVSAKHNPFWFTGYNYNGEQITQTSIQHLKKEVLNNHGKKKVFACVDLANKAYLSNNFNLLYNTIDYAIAYCISFKSSENDSLRYYLYNLKAERLIYAGKYVKAYEVIKEGLSKIPIEHTAHTFLKYNRIKLLAKSIPPFHILGMENLFTDLIASFKEIKAYTPYVETLLMKQQNFPQNFTLDELKNMLSILPEPYKSEGLMNLYFYTGQQHPIYLFNAFSIPPSSYLSYFRLNMGLAMHFNKKESYEKVNYYLKRAHEVMNYLADHEVNRHYAEYYAVVENKIPRHKLAPAIAVKMIDFDYKEPFLASRSVAADLLEEAKIEIEKERTRNQLFIRWLIILLTIVVVLLFFVFYGYKKLKKSTIYNNWITTAISHDLRSPVAHIAYSLNQPNGMHTAKANLMSYEYLLDDTLSMALRIHHNREVKFKQVDLIDLLDEIMLDLKFIIHDKQLIIERNLPNELIVKGDYTGLKILLRNLFLNAVKHNKEKGLISINSTPKEPKKITIRNTINPLSQTKSSTAGEEIINFFSKQNKVNNTFYIVNDTAYSELHFS